MRRELQDDCPSWQIWYVFHRDGSATWHGRPNPWLSASSPDDLRKLISQANTQTDGDAAAGFPQRGRIHGCIWDGGCHGLFVAGRVSI